ncbi:PREDICTED: glutathione S-transferase T3-like [Camelina sativa]|uniref:Glutathione S-transferase T3-like n=1 Tax=Camelina sativa TaxID=90675 RepID=A0ABM0Y4F6_CAMSA|nr:PREDICTED: glutathione S-transferase T3-like [Camelina sativa]
MSSYNTFSQSSSSYVDLLNSQGDTLNLDGAYEVPPYSSQESHQDVPLSQETHIRKDRKKWNPADDEALISAWLNTSKDRIIGNQQKGGSFWQRVNKYYADTPHAIGNGEQGMNINCKQRWFRINECTNKFCSGYTAAERLNCSGHSENDVLKMAHDIYFAEHNTKFTMEHCWCLLRPQGIKAAKAKRNNAQGKAFAEYKSMLEVKRVDMAEKEKLQKLGILDTLLAKPEPLSEADQLIKDKIVAQYF